MLVNRSHRDIDGDDEGSTLVVVLIVMLVLTIGALSLSAVVTNTTGLLASSSDRAKAQATVDAGISAQTARLESGVLPCAAGAGDDVQVIEGDPDSATYDFALECGGGVATLTVTTASFGASVSRQTVFAYDVVATPAKEPALVTRAPLDLSALKIKTVNPEDPATVWVVPEAGMPGGFSCNSGGAIAGSVYLPAGTVFGTGGCEVDGDVYAEGSITISNGTTIRGDLVSLNGNITVSGGNVIEGNIYAKGNVTGSSLSRNFVESIHAVGNVNLSGGAPVARDKITYGGTFTYAHSGHDAWAGGSVQKRVVNPPQLPTAPQWEKFTQADLDALVASNQFTRVVWSGACTHSWNHPMKAVVEGLTSPTLIDARACSRVELPGQWSQLKLKTDIIFVAPSFSMVGQDFVSGDGNEHRIWIISPEEPARDCAAVLAINAQGVKMTPYGSGKISGMIFTQCTLYFANASENWQGSIHAGTMSGQPNFWYKPVGFPGRELPESGGGEGGGESSLLQNLTVVSNRDVP